MIKTDFKIDNTPRASKKEIAKLSRLNELIGIFKERCYHSKNLDEHRLYLLLRIRIRRLVQKLEKRFDWRDEVFSENGLIGLRNVNGDVLVSCGDYDSIYGFNYYDDASFAIASRNGLYGLVKRDGQGAVVIPFNYLDIQLMDYYSCRFIPYIKYNIHIGYRATDRIVRDLIVNGEVVVSGADWISSCEDGVIVYRDVETGKCGFYGVYWDGLLTEPLFDEVIIRELEPITFIKDGKRGVMTTDKRFISEKEWDAMTNEQQLELWEDLVGYQ